MSKPAVEFASDHAINLLLRFLAVEGITGQEREIGQEVVKALCEANVPRDACVFDRANKLIPHPTQTGNLIVQLPGTLPGPRVLFMTHLDTVPLCAGAKPVRKNDRIESSTPTALGGDNRTGVACLVNLATTLTASKVPHPPITLLFTVREESGLWGARHVDLNMLGQPVHGFNIDGSSAEEITIGAVGADRWQVEIVGKASHAGVHPERGISATMIASVAHSEVFGGGWFGKVRCDGKEGTSNIGVVSGRDGKTAGDATNVVTDYVSVRGESRSHDVAVIDSITDAYHKAYENAVNRVVDHAGNKGRMSFTKSRDYFPFRVSEQEPVVKYALEAGRSIGLNPFVRTSNGGLDANWIVRHGIPTITFGAGQRNVHTTEEFVDVPSFLQGCRMAIALATS